MNTRHTADTRRRIARLEDMVLSLVELCRLHSAQADELELRVRKLEDYRTKDSTPRSGDD
jgi:hypothetical protein